MWGCKGGLSGCPDAPSPVRREVVMLADMVLGGGVVARAKLGSRRAV